MRGLITAALLALLWAPATSANWFEPKPAQSDLPSVDEALVLQPAILENGVLTLSWDIAEGCYLYRDRLAVEAEGDANTALGAPQWPDGEWVEDAHFGKVEVYRQRLHLHIRVNQTAPDWVRVRYQGCAEDRVCYPPQERLVEVINLSATP